MNSVTFRIDADGSAGVAIITKETYLNGVRGLAVSLRKKPADCVALYLDALRHYAVGKLSLRSDAKLSIEIV
jgi:hypothetical protein